MSAGPGMHDGRFAELLPLYALRALAPEEAASVEAHISDCAACAREVAALRQVLGALAGWPTDVLPAPASLWDRLARRIAGDTGQPPVTVSPAPEATGAPAWEEAAPDIECMLLASDREQHRVSMLVRLAPGAEYPPHRHAGVEEVYLLDGELWIDERKLFPGDYNRAEPDTADRRVWTETGCTCVLLTSTRDVLG